MSHRQADKINYSNILGKPGPITSYSSDVCMQICMYACMYAGMYALCTLVFPAVCSN